MNTNTITISRAALAACLPAVGVKDVRYYLNGVRLTPAADGGGVVAVATDGHRVHVARDPLGVWGASGSPGVILPADAVKRAVKGKRETVSVTLAGDGEVSVTTADDSIIRARLVEWRSPALDIAAILPLSDGAMRPDCMTAPVFLADMMEGAATVTKGLKCAGAGVAFDVSGRVFVQASGLGDVDYVALAMPLRNTEAWLGDRSSVPEGKGDGFQPGEMPILARVRRALGG